MTDFDDRNERSRDLTPAETPFSKHSSMPQYERMYHYLASLEIRLAVIEKTQVYLVNRFEGVEEVDSIVAAERLHLQKSSKNLLDRWVDACREDFESERPSQSIVVNVEPRAIAKPSAFPALSKFRTAIVLIGVVVAGVVTGIIWVIDLLKSLKP